MLSSFFGGISAKVALYGAAALGAIATILGALGAARSAGKTAEKAANMKRTQEQNNADAAIKADVDATSNDAARQRLRDKWSKR